MIEANVKDLLADRLKALDTTDHYIYMVWHGDTVFYIGQSQDPAARLRSHLGNVVQGKRGSTTALGNLILDSLPESRNWQITLLTILECGYWIRACFPTHTEWNVNMAERAMIFHFRPCLNVADNPLPTPLPEHYHNTPKGPWASITSLLADSTENAAVKEAGTEAATGGFRVALRLIALGYVAGFEDGGRIQIAGNPSKRPVDLNTHLQGPAARDFNIHLPPRVRDRQLPDDYVDLS
jgi:hypothetical protein